MSYIIHMDTEIVRDFASTSYLKVAAYWEEIENLSKKVQNLPWEGATSLIYQSQFRVLSKNIERSIENICELLFKVTKEVDGWIAVDQRNAGLYSKMKSENKTDRNNFIEEFVAETISAFKRNKFDNWWKELSYEEKLDFIRKEHEKIARSLGLEPVLIYIEDTNGNGDSFYLQVTNTITIDPSVLADATGVQVLGLIAHETRHVYQHNCVVFYEQTGSPPEGISIDQVKNWKSNLDNYISRNDDPPGYKKQTIEVDAYDYGWNYKEEYLYP